MATKDPIHPAILITNIKNCIPITLDEDGHLHNTWSSLFQLHCGAHLVLEHIVPDDKNPPTEDATWHYLDDLVCTWIYGTISVELIKPVLDPTDKALDTWNRLVNRFQNNKTTRILTLESQFNFVHLSVSHRSKHSVLKSRPLPMVFVILGHPFPIAVFLFKFYMGLPKITIHFGLQFSI